MPSDSRNKEFSFQPWNSLVVILAGGAKLIVPVKRLLKLVAYGIAVVFVCPLALCELLARRLMRRDAWFMTQGEALSLLPGKVGYFLRNAYYLLTLRKCGLDCQIGFGTYFTHSEAEVGHSVYAGTRCLIGIATIGDRVLLADHVQILSGGRQHIHAGSEDSRFRRIKIGADSWIGAGAILMADVGENCIIGAGSVVTRTVPDASVAVGNPAKVIRPNVPPRSVTA